MMRCASLLTAIIKNDEDETISRLGDSIQTAFFEGKGDCYVRYKLPESSEVLPTGEDLGGAVEKRFFCDRFELDDIRFEEPSPNFFSFNNPYGACKRCEGYGKVIGIDEDLVIPIKAKPFTRAPLPHGAAKKCANGTTGW
jgi:excinuclease ABC subunit A